MSCHHHVDSGGRDHDLHISVFFDLHLPSWNSLSAFVDEGSFVWNVTETPGLIFDSAQDR